MAHLVRREIRSIETILSGKEGRGNQKSGDVDEDHADENLLSVFLIHSFFGFLI